VNLSIEEARTRFPFLASDIYLDNASASLSFDQQDRAAGRFFREHKSRGITAREGWRSEASAARVRIGKLINAKPSEVLFLSNTSEGINMVSNIIEWRPGDEVIIADNEFPGNVYPWTCLKKSGVRIRVVQNMGGTLSPDLYASCISSKTRLISFSHINWLSGYKVNLGEMREMTKGTDILLCVDACQSLCAVPLDAQYVDFISASVFKWPLGPFGLSVFYVSERVAERCRPNYISYMSVKDELGVSFEAPELREGPQKFQYAHINYPGIYALNGALEFLDQIGIDKVQKRIAELVEYLVSGLHDLGITEVTPEDHDRRGGIVSARAGKAQHLLEILKEAGIHVSLRNDRLRISPHFYNNKADIDGFLDAMRSASDF